MCLEFAVGQLREMALRQQFVEQLEPPIVELLDREGPRAHGLAKGVENCKIGNDLGNE